MAVWTIKTLDQLVGNFVMGPERYDPRRNHLQESPGANSNCVLGDLICLNRKTVTASATLGQCLVLDTSDAKEGIITNRKPTVEGALIGSQKKVVAHRDVIISRLRPYLRQAAYVDEAIEPEGNATIVASTEFFVLRPLDERSIAFLVPFLLCDAVQKVLSVSQEGGHHPRFDEQTLLSVPMPDEWLEQRDSISKDVERAAQLYRQQQGILSKLVQRATSVFREVSP
ncbi:hypothetical protein IAD21_01264 [Abditibacteriota bacterium]|nr:hypothetical protein IAD21_01264 [Abditibacteriota bacterium]